MGCSPVGVEAELVLADGKLGGFTHHLHPLRLPGLSSSSVPLPETNPRLWRKQVTR